MAVVCELTSCGVVEMYINGGKAIPSPYGNNKFCIQGSHKQVTYGQGELRYYAPVSNGKDQVLNTGLFRGSHLGRGDRDILPRNFL
jgi:hypothetical protein